MELSESRSKIIINALINTIEHQKKKLDARREAFSIVANSEGMLQSYLVNKHPELSSEFIEFVVSDIKASAPHGVNPQSALSAIGYHNDEFASDEIKEAIKTIKAIEWNNND
jgi:metal-responsive CopG/Arc/MetJ family transcriptional regulator